MEFFEIEMSKDMSAGSAFYHQSWCGAFKKAGCKESGKTTIQADIQVKKELR